MAPSNPTSGRQLQEVHKISIVDDDASVRVATQSLVMSLGYRAYAFASAQMFLQSPRLNDTSCLISDVHMPNMSGLELQSLLIAQARLIPIIFITAFYDETLMERALRAGAGCFLQKRFDGQSLIGCLEAALRRGGGASA